MKKMGFYLFVLLFLWAAQNLVATDYFVDSNSGNDGNNGLSPSTAWRTVGKVNSFMRNLEPGDSVLFRRGCSFKGQGELYVSEGGAQGNTITFGAYGTGNKPLLDKVRSSTANLGHVAIQDFSIEDGVTAISFYGNNMTHITISRCDIDNMSNNAIFLQKIDTYVIEDCTITNCSNSGIVIYGSEFYKIRNGIIRNNIVGEIHNNDGITIHKEDVTKYECGPYHELINNVCYNCAENGIDLTSAINVTLHGNETYGSGEGGILCGGTDVWIDRHFSHDEEIGMVFGGNVNAKLTSSVIYNARYHQLVVVPTTECINFEAYHNTIVYGPDSTGLLIDINNNVRGVKFINNIFTSVQSSRPSTYVRFARGATPSSTDCLFDHNIYWRPDGDNSRLWSVGDNINWSTWQGTWHMDIHSYWGDPRLVNPDAWDFHIRENSPGVDTGIDVNVNRDFEGTPIPRGLAPDIGADERDGETPLGADADASPRSGEAPVTVNFSAEAWGGNSPYTYRWTFGDGGSSTQQNPSHTYSQPGTYTARLTVTDQDSEQETDSLSITVSAVPSLSAGIVASPTSGEAPLAVSFTGSASGGTPPYSFAWAFGDGSSSTQQNPSHTYSQAGTYQAVLTVTDSRSNQDTSSLSINVSAPTAQLTASAGASPLSGTAPLAVIFSGSVAGGNPPSSYNWTFGDGGSSAQQNPSHTYSQSGTYQAVLTVTDSRSNQDTSSLSINVSAPTAQLTASAGASPLSGTAPLAVIFSGSVAGGNPPYSYNWTFGDGGSSAQQNPSHTYSQSGTYQATFTVTDSTSQQKSASVNITVSAVPIEFNLNLAISTGLPATGQSGIIEPSPGNHSFLMGSRVQLRATPRENFRFSRWLGNISTENAGRSDLTITLNGDRTVTALFCSSCGDVNGDKTISPLDAQAVFDIFLGKNPNPTICQLENGDVNGDGTRTEPRISPADAQIIFRKYLGKRELPCDCSYNIRTASLLPLSVLSETAGLEKPAQDIHLGLGEMIKISESEIHLPIMINNPRDIDAFGFDFVYPVDIMEFVGVARTEMVKDFYQVEGNRIEEGMIRVGGYSSDAIIQEEGGELVLLIFKLKKKGVNSSVNMHIAKTFDDVASAFYIEPTGGGHGVQKSRSHVRR